MDCPGVESGPGPCRASGRSSCVDDTDHHLTGRGVAAIIVVGLVGFAATLGLLYVSIEDIGKGLGTDGGR